MKVSDRTVRPLGLAMAVTVFTLSFFRGFGVGLGHSIILTPVDFVIGILGLVWVTVVVHRGEIVTTRLEATALVVMSLFVFYISLLSLLSPVALRALTLVLLVVRDMLLFTVLITTLDTDVIPILNRMVYTITSIIAAGMFVVYVGRTQLGLNIGGVFESTFYTPTGVTRVRWFAADPNFFGLFLTVGLFVGLYQIQAKRSVWEGLKLLVIIATILLIFSRAIILIIVCMAVLVGVSRLRTVNHGLNFRSAAPAGAFVVVAGGALLLVSENFAYRFTRVSFARLNLWTPLVQPTDLLSVVFGHGLRAAEVAVGRYPHNSYLELWYDTGTIGISLYTLVVGVSAISVVRDWIRGDCGDITPWWYALVAVLVFFIPFSFQYQPLVWLVLGVVAASVSDRSLLDSASAGKE